MSSPPAAAHHIKDRSQGFLRDVWFIKGRRKLQLFQSLLYRRGVARAWREQDTLGPKVPFMSQPCISSLPSPGKHCKGNS